LLSLAWKLFINAHASISVLSTLKPLARQEPLDVRLGHHEAGRDQFDPDALEHPPD